MKSKIFITIFLLFFQNNITFAKIAPIGSTSSVGSANIMFLLDVSGSMQGSRLQLMKNAVNKIVQDPNLSKNSNFGVISWQSSATLLVGITSSVYNVTTAVNRLTASGGTNASAALGLVSSLSSIFFTLLDEQLKSENKETQKINFKIEFFKTKLKSEIFDDCIFSSKNGLYYT
jgi:hypothetical protein